MDAVGVAVTILAAAASLAVWPFVVTFTFKQLVATNESIIVRAAV